MNVVEAIGYLASACTTLSFVPQVARILRTRNVLAISLPMYAIFTAGVALWLAYGVALGAWPIIIANALTLILSASVLFLKLTVPAPADPSDTRTRFDSP